MIPFGQDEGVKIDRAHANMVQALVECNKPQTILEFGIGGGQSTDAILAGLYFNQQPFEYTLVDNWHDWGGQRPAGVNEKYGDRITIIDSGEREYVFSCEKRYDFIMSDGDHFQTDQWFEYVFENLLNPGGIIIYHDVNFVDADAFMNLKNLYFKCKEYNIRHQLFNRNSRSDERCQRGLLIIFKDESASS